MVRPRLAGGVSARNLSLTALKRIDVKLRMGLLRTSEAARLLNVPTSKLSRQLTAARKRGLLPPAVKGSASLLGGHVRKALADNPEADGDHQFNPSNVGEPRDRN